MISKNEEKKYNWERGQIFFSRKSHATIDIYAIRVMHFPLEFKKCQFFRLSTHFSIEAMQNYYAHHVIIFFSLNIKMLNFYRQSTIF